MLEGWNSFAIELLHVFLSLQMVSRLCFIPESKTTTSLFEEEFYKLRSIVLEGIHIDTKLGDPLIQIAIYRMCSSTLSRQNGQEVSKTVVYF